LPQERVGVPDFLEQVAIGERLGKPGDAHLVVAFVKVAQFAFRFGGDFPRLVIGAQIGDEDGEAIGAHGGNRPQPGLIAVHGGKMRKAVGLHHGECKLANLGRFGRHENRLSHVGASFVWPRRRISPTAWPFSGAC
jgi:hypothetical protein